MLLKGNYLATGVLAVSDRIQWVHLGGGNADFAPSGVVFESSDASGVNTAVYVWASDSGGLLYHTGIPTADSDGTAVASGGTGDVSADAAFATDNILIMSDGTAKKVQKTGIGIHASNYSMTLPDGASLSLQENITFGGATTVNHIKMPDNLADGLSFEDASANSYLKFVSTTASKGVTIGQTLTAPSGSKIGNLTLGDGSIVDSGGTIATTGHVHIDGDDKQLQIGNETTDSYITFNGTSLMFYDTEVGSAQSLNTLMTGTQLNPTVTGDLGIANGKFDWTDSTDETAATWVFSNTGAGSDIDIGSAVTTGEGIHIIANDLTTGSALLIETDGTGAAGTLLDLDITAAGHNTTGNFIRCYDGSGDVFEVGKYGALTIAGTAGGTAAITVTKGDLVLSDGIINLDLDSNHGALNVTRNYTGAASTPVAYIKEDYTGANQAALQVVSDVTGAYDTVIVDHAGTEAAVLTNVSNTAGDGLEVVLASGATGNGIFINGTTTNGYVGAAAAGMVHIKQDGTMTNAAASALRVDYDGTPAALACGYAINVDDDGDAIASSYAVSINSANNTPLKLETGATTKPTLLIEATAAQTASTLKIDGDTNDFTGADNVGLVHIDNDSAAQNAGASLLVLDFAGTGTSGAEGTCFRALDTGSAASGTPYAAEIASTANNGLQISTGAAGKTALTLKSYTNATASTLIVDGDLNGWTGDNNTGMVHLKNDIALAQTTASTLLIDVGTTAPKDAAKGYCLRVADTSLVATSNNAYAVVIDSTANHGLEIITQAAAATNLTVSGVAAQTAPLIKVDASTGTGWDGADDTGALEITSDSILVANGATLLRVESAAQQKAGSEGALARFENTGAAQANAVMVEIVAKDETEVALNVGSGMVTVADWVTAGGYHHVVTDVTATDAGLQLSDKYGFYTFDETTGDNGDILLLPTAVVGMEMWLQNIDAAQSVELKPYSGEQINGLGANTATTVAAGSLVHCICSVTGHWRANTYAADGTITACA